MNVNAPVRNAAATVFSVAVSSACPSAAFTTGSWLFTLGGTRCTVITSRSRESEEVSRYGSSSRPFACALGGASAADEGAKLSFADRLMALRAKAIAEGMPLKSTDEILRDRLAMWENA